MKYELVRRSSACFSNAPRCPPMVGVVGVASVARRRLLGGAQVTRTASGERALFLEYRSCAVDGGKQDPS